MSIDRLAQYVPDIVAKYIPNLKYTTIEGTVQDIADVVSISKKARESLNPDEYGNLMSGLMKQVRLDGRSFYVAVPDEHTLQIDAHISLCIEKYSSMDFLTIRGEGENLPFEAQHAWWQD
tara:strand:- start:3096 stop:3455 length:360 start_codon:yes stop_codon:yes gene_type:complete